MVKGAQSHWTAERKGTSIAPLTEKVSCLPHIPYQKYPPRKFWRQPHSGVDQYDRPSNQYAVASVTVCSQGQADCTNTSDNKNMHQSCTIRHVSHYTMRTNTLLLRPLGCAFVLPRPVPAWLNVLTAHNGAPSQHGSRCWRPTMVLLARPSTPATLTLECKLHHSIKTNKAASLSFINLYSLSPSFLSWDLKGATSLILVGLGVACLDQAKEVRRGSVRTNNSITSYVVLPQRSQLILRPLTVLATETADSRHVLLFWTRLDLCSGSSWCRLKRAERTSFWFGSDLLAHAIAAAMTLCFRPMVQGYWEECECEDHFQLTVEAEFSSKLWAPQCRKVQCEPCSGVICLVKVWVESPVQALHKAYPKLLSAPL